MLLLLVKNQLKIQKYLVKDFKNSFRYHPNAHPSKNRWRWLNGLEFQFWAHNKLLKVEFRMCYFSSYLLCFHFCVWGANESTEEDHFSSRTAAAVVVQQVDFWPPIRVDPLQSHAESPFREGRSICINKYCNLNFIILLDGEAFFPAGFWGNVLTLD